jgi:hypothetical protein
MIKAEMKDTHCQFCGRNITKAERNNEPIHCFNCWKPWMGPFKGDKQ